MGTIVYDAGSVHKGVQIRQIDLDALALAICEYGLHDRTFSNQSPGADESFEAELKSNGGYCNRCMEDAGYILSKFLISPREDAE